MSGAGRLLRRKVHTPAGTGPELLPPEGEPVVSPEELARALEVIRLGAGQPGRPPQHLPALHSAGPAGRRMRHSRAAPDPTVASW